MNPVYDAVSYGEPASAKNQRRIVQVGGKPRLIKSKKALDRACENLVGSSSASPGETTTLYSDSLFVFSKRMNEDSIVCSAKDLVIELNKLGVDPDIIAKAQEAATKVKKGNVYYNVDVNEHEG